MEIRIFYDEGTASPNEWGGWKLHSFNRRHLSFKDPSVLQDTHGNLHIGWRRKFAVGTAFMLSYYEHGDCLWTLTGEGPYCRFDSVVTAGYLEWIGPDKLPPGYAEREKYARAFLKSYTAWANGQIFVVECGDDSCGDVYDVEEHIETVVGPDWRSACQAGNDLAKHLF